MAPKSKKTHDQGESSRAPRHLRRYEEQPLEDLTPPYSNPRFVSLETQQRYTKMYSSRSVLCERGIMLDDYMEASYNLQWLMLRRGWEKWVKFQSKVVVPLVKEFYSNVTTTRDDLGNRCLVTEVRGTKVYFTPSVITSMFGLPTQAPLLELEVPEDSFEKERLTTLLAESEDVVWLGRRFPKARLSLKCNILHRLVCSHFLPQAYTSSVSME